MTGFVFDDSGKVRKPTAVDLAAADRDATILTYTTGTMEDGRPYYAYVAVKPSVYAEFYALTSAHKPIIIGEYGTVIAAGFSPEAPPEVVKEMRDIYGFDEHYLDKLQAELSRDGKSFFEKKEEARVMDIVAMMKKMPGSTTAN